MGRPAHDPIGHPEGVHHIKRDQRHMRRLEHVAAGVEDEVRPLAGLGSRSILQSLVHLLPEAREFIFIELHARQHVDAVRDQPEILDALLAPVARLN